MQEPLSIALCEDSPEDAAAMRAYIDQSGYPALTECFASGEAFLKGFEKGRYHLIFLDIFMGGISGVATAEAIRAKDSRVALVFTTASRDFTLESYRLNALLYLEKPARVEGVLYALELAWALRERREVCTVYAKRKRMEIALCSIHYIEVIDHTCIIHLEDGTVETDMRMDDFARILPPGRFLRCHRCYIVNLDHVAGVERDFIMKNGEIVYIRGKDIKKMGDAYKRYLVNKAREDGVCPR